LSDDDPRLREALEFGISLQWEDAQVVTAADGEEGLQRFVEHEADVVLLDVTMPRMSWLEVLRLMRRVSDVPVIMLSAKGEDIRCAGSRWAPMITSRSHSATWRSWRASNLSSVEPSFQPRSRR
jgi:CheY-like chemotaxis protein